MSKNPQYNWRLEQPWKAVSHICFIVIQKLIRVENYCALRAKGPQWPELELAFKQPDPTQKALGDLLADIGVR